MAKSSNPTPKSTPKASSGKKYTIQLKPKYTIQLKKPKPSIRVPGGYA